MRFTEFKLTKLTESILDEVSLQVQEPIQHNDDTEI